jgi:hypothetical protein
MAEAGLRVFGIDWSGKIKKASETIWLAEAQDGKIVQLENGRTPDELIDFLVEEAKYSKVLAGLDFAFSMPAWYVQEHAISAADFWGIVAKRGEAWLGECPSPFYGFAGTQRCLDRELLRATEKSAPGAKSTFQINGPGAVGVGSIRGMPHLLRLRAAGWKIWPFDPPDLPLAVEIYPRLLIGKVDKTAWRNRIEYMVNKFPNLEPRFQERAAGSEDAFDAAVSALILDRHAEELANLPDWSAKDPVSLEGWIWAPSA